MASSIDGKMASPLRSTSTRFPSVAGTPMMPSSTRRVRASRWALSSRLSSRMAAVTAPRVSRRDDAPSVAGQVADARKNVVGQQFHGAAPRLRVVGVVEAKQQEMPEAAHGLVDGLQLAGDSLGRADQPVVLGAVLDGHVD